MTLDHDAPPAPLPPAPLNAVPDARRRSPAEEARTLIASASVAQLATLTADGGPWASTVAYAATALGEPVLLVSTLAAHGRQLLKDPRASIAVAEAGPHEDPLSRGRVTLAGVAEQPVGDEADAARDAYIAAVPYAAVYAGFGDFHLWVLRVREVRWVGGYGRMDNAVPADYAVAEADPVGVSSQHAVDHLNEDHADALLSIATAFSGHPDATAAKATAADRYGIDLVVDTPRGSAPARVGFPETVGTPGGLRSASVALTKAAREATGVA